MQHRDGAIELLLRGGSGGNRKTDCADVAGFRTARARRPLLIKSLCSSIDVSSIVASTPVPGNDSIYLAPKVPPCEGTRPTRSCRLGPLTRRRGYIKCFTS